VYPRRLLRDGLLLFVALLLVALLLPGAALAASDAVGVRATTGPAPTSVTMAATISYIDVLPGDPFYAAIYALAAAQVITGFPDHTFRPDAPIKRMQFAKMICLGMFLTPSLFDPCPFNDVPSGLDPLDPFYPDHYVTAAYNAGVAQGKTATKFAPYESITRYQLISMMVRAAKQQMPGRIKTPPASYKSSWDPSASKDHGQNARTAEYNGMLSYLPLDELDPWGAMPRGEVAQVVYNTIH
jgi:hypothetical protein